MSSLPFRLPDDPPHPVVYALRLALQKHRNEFYEAVTKLAAQTNEADVVQGMLSLKPRLERIVRIGRWIYYHTPLPASEAQQKAQLVQELGTEWVDMMASHLQKRPRGKPARKRWAYIAAFEYMLQGQKYSLGRAVPKFCICGAEHNPKCAVNMKAGIHEVTKVLREHAPELVARYDALHPDRAKNSRRSGTS